MAVTVVAVLLLVVGVVYTAVSSHDTAPGPVTDTPAPPVLSAVPTPTTTSPPDSTPGSDAEVHEPIGGANEPATVAAGFAADFVVHTTTGAQNWYERITRWTTPHLAQAYLATDIRNVPTGTLHQVRQHVAGASVVDFIATYDTFAIAIRVEYQTTGWQVSTVVPMTTEY